MKYFVLLLCIFALFTFVACHEVTLTVSSGDSAIEDEQDEEVEDAPDYGAELVGTWILTSNLRQRLTFQEDGSGFLYMTGEGLVNTFSWSSPAEQTLLSEGRRPGILGMASFSLRGNMLILTDSGPPFEELLFVREPNPRPFSIPEGLDEDIYSLTFGSNGIVYTLPMPLSTLLEDGWELVSILDQDGRRPIDSLAGRTLEPFRLSTAALFLINDQQIIRIVVSHPYPLLTIEEEISYYESFVSEIRVETFTGEWAKLALSGGVTMDAPLEGLNITDDWLVNEAREGMFPNVTIYQYFREYWSLSISVDKETQLVSAIQLGVRIPHQYFFYHPR